MAHEKGNFMIQGLEKSPYIYLIPLYSKKRNKGFFRFIPGYYMYYFFMALE